MDHSEMYQKTSFQFENFGTNVTHKAMIVMHLSKMTDKFFVNWKCSVAFPAFVVVHYPFEPSLQYDLVPFGVHQHHMKLQKVVIVKIPTAKGALDLRWRRAWVTVRLLLVSGSGGRCLFIV